MPRTTNAKLLLERRLQIAAGGAGVAAVGIGAMYLFAWLSGAMTYRLLEAVPMTTNSALCLLLSGVALLLILPRGRGRGRRRAVQALSTVVMTVGALTLLEDLSGWNLGIDQLLAHEQAGILYHNRLNLPGAVGFILAAAAILLVAEGGTAAVWVSQVLGLPLCLNGLLGILGYLYGALGSEANHYTAATFPTNVGFLLVGTGIVLARPGEALVAPLVSPDPGGAALRHLLLPALVIPIVLGWFCLQGEWHGLYGRYFGTSLLATSFIAIFSLLIFVAGQQLARSSAAEQAATEALQESEERLRLFIEHAPAALAMFDRQMRYLSVSRRWLSDHGFEGRDMRGLSHYDTFPDIPSRWREVHRRALDGERIGPEEDSFLRSDGSVQWLRWEVLPWHDATGGVAGIVIFSEDITRQKVAEAALRQAKDDMEAQVRERTKDLAHALQDLERQSEERVRAVEELREKEQMLIHQNRLAAMGEMIGNIAHQWRQPLNVLALLVQDLRVSYETETFDRAYLDTTVERSMAVLAHMSATIDDFRNFFQLDKGIASFSVGDVVTATISLMEAGLKKQGVTVEVDEQEELRVEGYRNQFAQVLLNLLMNARDALTEHHVQQPQIRIRIFRTHDGRGAITVTDNAGGVPEAIMDRVFEPYFTTKGPDKGTGIGLFMAKAIIEKNMKGSISLRNTAEGAEFTIVL